MFKRKPGSTYRMTIIFFDVQGNGCLLKNGSSLKKLALMKPSRFGQAFTSIDDGYQNEISNWFLADSSLMRHIVNKYKSVGLGFYVVQLPH